MGNWQLRHTVIPAVFLIFRDGDKVLLLRRANTGYMDGSYSLPAGHVDGDEPAVAAACREAKEEVGVDITPDDLEFVHVMHEKAEGHERVNFGFEVQHYKGTLANTEPNKCDALRWASIHDLPRNTVSQVRVILEQVDKGAVYSDHNFSV
jgi:8-oxo-dGTP pyrophosphatase MutT (NUDIX family)